MNPTRKDTITTAASFTRRLFLGRAAAALPALAVASVPTLAAAAVNEDPQLQELGERIQPLLDAYRSAKSRREETLALANRALPQVPEELIDREVWGDSLMCGISKEERDANNDPIRPPFDKNKAWNEGRRIFCSESLEFAKSDFGLGPRTKAGKRLRALIPIAKKYEADREAAIQASGFPEADCDLSKVAFEFDDLARAIAKTEPRTLAGTLIYARAMVAYGETDDSRKFFGWSAQILGPGLAKAIVQTAGE